MSEESRPAQTPKLYVVTPPATPPPPPPIPPPPPPPPRRKTPPSAPPAPSWLDPPDFDSPPQSALDRMRAAAAKLNQLTDEVNEAYKTAEDFLNNACSIGIHAFVNGFQSEDGCQWLEYRRVAGKFRIAIVWGFVDDPESETVKPWSEASREDKLDCIELLPKLIEEVAKKTEERVGKTEQAARLAINMFKKEGK